MLPGNELVIPALETVGLMKFVTWLKLIIEKIPWIPNIGSYGGWILTVLVAVVWKAALIMLSGGQIDAGELWAAVQLAIQAIVTYGFANAGILGGTAKNFVTKPIL